jgi:hypothetical protein
MPLASARWLRWSERHSERRLVEEVARSACRRQTPCRDDWRKPALVASLPRGPRPRCARNARRERPARAAKPAPHRVSRSPAPAVSSHRCHRSWFGQGACRARQWRCHVTEYSASGRRPGLGSHRLLGMSARQAWNRLSRDADRVDQRTRRQTRPPKSAEPERSLRPDITTKFFDVVCRIVHRGAISRAGRLPGVDRACQSAPIR